MDNNIKWVEEQKIKRTMENLEKNNIEAYFVEDNSELIEKISELVKEGDTVSVGGSMTLFETGVIEFLRKGNFNYLDRYAEGLKGDDLKDIYRKTFSADAYFVSSNAVTEKGELYNVDGNGNRVAAMLFGPKKVIVVVGVNKLVKDIDEAIKRNREVAAPANAKRLNRDTPCAKVGYCVECNSSDRICNEYTIIKRQGDKDRIHVIFLNEQLGY